MISQDGSEKTLAQEKLKESRKILDTVVATSRISQLTRPTCLLLEPVLQENIRLLDDIRATDPDPEIETRYNDVTMQNHLLRMRIQGGF